jgi:hypothetical protein
MQSFSAHHTPNYTAQTLCAREKRAVVLPYAFGLRSIVAGWTWCASARGGRGGRDTRMIVNAHHVTYACMQSSSAHHAPHYTAQTLCAREKRAVVLPHAFGWRPIVAGWTWCATRMASAAAARTATTRMHSPAHQRLRQPLRRQRCTARPRFTRPAWPRRVYTTRATKKNRKPSMRCTARPQKVNFRGGRENSSDAVVVLHVCMYQH